MQTTLKGSTTNLKITHWSQFKATPTLQKCLYMQVHTDLVPTKNLNPMWNLPQVQHWVIFALHKFKSAKSEKRNLDCDSDCLYSDLLHRCNEAVLSGTVNLMSNVSLQMLSQLISEWWLTAWASNQGGVARNMKNKSCYLPVTGSFA